MGVMERVEKPGHPWVSVSDGHGSMNIYSLKSSYIMRLAFLS